ncbi:large ribosomal subunit protein bL35c-like [Nicotiana tabacum]|uniref:Large ribosomal subunit protein bL35c-like n=2 Tax=Nicotiana TaxID=4085 RepID=A0AC58RXK3_TOBAC|nr:PREDICTED: 50S ribosomal protein L35, chloroplastic [Nicotiana sylvestris]
MSLTMASSSSTSLFSTFLNLSPQKATGFTCRTSVKIPSITQKTSLNLSSSHNISAFAPIVFNKVSFAATPTNGNPQPLTVVCAKGYKMKTHKASAKRFKVSGTGKILRRRAGKQHLLRKKNAKRRNRLSKTVQVDRSDYNNVIGALPYLKVNRAN